MIVKGRFITGAAASYNRALPPRKKTTVTIKEEPKTTVTIKEEPKDDTEKKNQARTLLTMLGYKT